MLYQIDGMEAQQQNDGSKNSRFPWPSWSEVRRDGIKYGLGVTVGALMTEGFIRFEEAHHVMLPITADVNALIKAAEGFGLFAFAVAGVAHYMITRNQKRN